MANLNSEYAGYAQTHYPLTYGAQGGVDRNPLLAVFGKAAYQPSRQDASRNHQTTIDTMAEIFNDPRKTQPLADMYEGLVGMGVDYLLAYVAPLKPTDEMRKDWKTFTFNKPLADPVPHLGVSRTIKHSVKTGSVTMMRHGIAMTFEHDFLTHREGVEMWVNSVRQTQLIVQRTLYFDIMVALLESGREEKTWRATHGLENIDTERLCKEERKQYAAFHKQFNALEQLDQMVKTAAKRMSQPPNINLYIFPEEAYSILQFTQPKRMFFMYTGRDQQVAGEVLGPAIQKRVNGTPAFPWPHFEYDNGEDSSAQMNRKPIIGVFHPVFDHLEDTDMRNRTAEDRHVFLFNENINNFDRVTPKMVHNNSGRWHKPTGELDPKHWELARNGNSDTEDIFLYRQDQQLCVTECFGQMEKKYMDSTVMGRLVKSVYAHVSEADRAAIDALFGLYKQMAEIPSLDEDVVAALAAYDDAARDPTANSSAEKLRLLMVHFSNPEVCKRTPHLASFVGLEHISRIRDPSNPTVQIARVGLAAYNKFAGQLRNIFTTESFVLDSARCAEWAKSFVSNASDANLWQHIVAVPVIPLVLDDTTQRNSFVVPVPEEGRGLMRNTTTKAFASAKEYVAWLQSPKYDEMHSAVETLSIKESSILKAWLKFAKSIQKDTLESHADRTAFTNEERVALNLYGALLHVVHFLHDLDEEKHVSIEAESREKIADLSKYFFDDLAHIYDGKRSIAAIRLDDGLDMAVAAAKLIMRLCGKLLSSVPLGNDANSNRAMALAFTGELETFIDGSVNEGDDDDNEAREKVAKSYANFNDNIQERVDAEGGVAFQSLGEALVLLIRPVSYVAMARDQEESENAAIVYLPLVLPRRLVTSASKLSSILPGVGTAPLNPVDGFATAIRSDGDNVLDVLKAAVSRPIHPRSHREFSAPAEDTPYDSKDEPVDYDSQGFEMSSNSKKRAFDDGAWGSQGHGVSSGYADKRVRSEDNDAVDAAGLDMRSPLHFSNSNNFKRNHQDILLENDAIKKCIMGAFVYAPVNKRVLDKIIDAGYVYIPFNWYVFRPHDMHEMLGGIAMQGGRETCETLWKSANVQVGHDVNIKSIYVNTTFYSTCAVYKDQNIMKLENMMYKRYLGGHNLDFYDDETADEIYANEWIPQDDRNRPSCYGIMTAATDSHTRRDRIDLKGMEEKRQRTLDPTGRKRKREEKDYMTADYYGLKWHFSECKMPEYGMLHFEPTSKPNSVMYMGCTKRWAGPGSFEGRTLVEQGHHGAHVGPGCSDVRDGLTVIPPTFKYVEDASV